MQAILILLQKPSFILYVHNPREKSHQLVLSKRWNKIIKNK